MRRMWINQPSIHQKYHKYHAVNVLVDIDNVAINHSREETVNCWFIRPDVCEFESMAFPKSALSNGWTGFGNKTPT